MYSEGMKLFEKKREEVSALSEELKSGGGEVPEKVDFVTSMLLSGKMNAKDLSVDIVDLLFAGTDTVEFLINLALCSLP